MSGKGPQRARFPEAEKIISGFEWTHGEIDETIMKPVYDNLASYSGRDLTAGEAVEKLLFAFSGAVQAEKNDDNRKNLQILFVKHCMSYVEVLLEGAPKAVLAEARQIATRFRAHWLDGLPQDPE